MAFKFVPCVWRCTAKSIQNCHIIHRSIIIPQNAGEPTRTNQEVIQALTRAVIGGMGMPRCHDISNFQFWIKISNNSNMSIT